MHKEHLALNFICIIFETY